MRNPQPLKDKIYNSELDRMRMLPRFPELPAARQEMVRVLRQITNSENFLRALITHFVDHGDHCPSARELCEHAQKMRSPEYSRAAGPCAKCGGTGWIRGTRTVTVAGMKPYEAEFSKRCECALGVAS